MAPGALQWGLSAGIAYSAIFLAASSGVSSTEHGVASAILSTAQQIGGAMGLAVLIAVANADLGARGATTGEVVAGLRNGMWTGAAVVVAGAFMALGVGRGRRSEAEAAHDRLDVRGSESGRNPLDRADFPTAMS